MIEIDEMLRTLIFRSGLPAERLRAVDEQIQVCLGPWPIRADHLFRSGGTVAYYSDAGARRMAVASIKVGARL